MKLRHFGWPFGQYVILVGLSPHFGIPPPQCDDVVYVGIPVVFQEAFAVLGIPNDEKMGMYRTTSAVMQFGEMKFKQRPREEQAEADGSAEAEKVKPLHGFVLVVFF